MRKKIIKQLLIVGAIVLLFFAVGSLEPAMADSGDEGIACTNCEEYYKWCSDLGVYQYRCRLGGDYCSVSNQPLCD